MYEYGQGVEPDDARALTWCGMSADQGNRHGINNLDYALGSVGAIKFRIEAEKYRAEAARLRDEPAPIESENQSHPQRPCSLKSSKLGWRRWPAAVHRALSWM